MDPTPSAPENIALVRTQTQTTTMTLSPPKSSRKSSAGHPLITIPQKHHNFNPIPLCDGALVFTGPPLWYRDFSMCRSKFQGPDHVHWSCPHRVFSNVNPYVYLLSAVLQCQQCDDLQRNEIDLPVSNFEICEDFEISSSVFDL